MSGSRVPQLSSRDDFMAENNADGVVKLSSPRIAGRARLTDLCPVCQDEIKGQEGIVCIVMCGHIFHDECLNPWIYTDTEACFGTCPVCRKKMFFYTGHHRCTATECRADDTSEEYDSEAEAELRRNARRQQANAVRDGIRRHATDPNSAHAPDWQVIRHIGEEKFLELDDLVESGQIGSPRYQELLLEIFEKRGYNSSLASLERWCTMVRFWLRVMGSDWSGYTSNASEDESSEHEDEDDDEDDDPMDEDEDDDPMDDDPNDGDYRPPRIRRR